jgi:hypothetical protein
MVKKQKKQLGGEKKRRKTKHENLFATILHPK